MTLKYESEVLFDLMKRDGDAAPSDVLPYESELKEKYLNQVVGAYPKLQDYQPEWLYYNLYHHLPSDFPVESVANVTSASFYDVVPYAYKSAILKGNTLVNLFNDDDSLSVEFSKSRWKYQNQVLNLIGGNKYYVYFFNKLNNLPLHIKPVNTEGEKGAFNVEANTGKVVTLDSTITYAFGYYYFKDGWTGEESKQDIIDKCKILFFEYQEGMENWDIPYFTGMQSVKLPVLTATGKNLFKTFKNNGYYHYSDSDTDTNNGSWINNSNFKCLSAKVLPNTQYTQSSKGEYTGNVLTFWKDGKFTGKGMRGNITGFITTPSDCDEIRVSCTMENDLQLELGKSSTPYEPYKSNILTVNEDIELRGIGEVKDELNLLTGELTQRIGEVVLDGSENWVYEPSYTNDKVYGCFILLNQLSPIPKPNNRDFANIIFPKNNSYLEEGFATNPSTLSLRIGKNKLETVDLSGFKKYLQNNPITLQYPVATESIKTVALSCINEQGENAAFRPIEGTMHVNTSSQTLPPLLDMSVPVEATTQNLMSFANIEEEE